jgi:HK97 family phage major capsid protein
MATQAELLTRNYVTGPLSGISQKRNVFEVGGITGKTAGIAERQYSLRDYLLQGPKFLQGNSYEKQVSEGIIREKGEQALGMFVPTSILTRDISLTGNGSNLVQTGVRHDLATALRPFSALVAAGASVLDDLTGQVSWPRMAVDFAASGYSENATVITDSSAAFSQMSLSAKRIGIERPISKQLLQQSNIDAEQAIRTEILRAIGAKLDQFALTGTGNPITGILGMSENSGSNTDLAKLNYQGVTFGGATATWAKVIGMPAALHQANVINDGTFSFIVDGATWNKWSSTPKVSTYPLFLIEDNKVAGYPVYVTQNLSATHQCIFLRASSFVFGIWGIDICANPFNSTFDVDLNINILCDFNTLYGPAGVRSEDSAAQ